MEETRYESQAGLLEAYEELLEECQLEAFIHHHPIALDSESEGEDRGCDEDGNTSEGEQAKDQKKGQHDSLVAWTKWELAQFFPSLARRSRFFPDLISLDLFRSKSTSQVAHLLSLLEQQSGKVEQRKRSTGCRDWQVPRSVSRADQRIRRVAKVRGAHEVSDEWLQLEEGAAAGLQQWEKLEDAERGAEETSIGAGGDVEDGDESLISWDTQVTNATLFLRHHPFTCPDSKPADFTSSAPHAVSSTEVHEPERHLFSFSALLGVQLLSGEPVADQASALPHQSYPSFALLHPVPNTRSGSEKERTTLSWRILYRAVELGFLAWVAIRRGNEAGSALPDGIVLSQIDRPLSSTQAGGPTFHCFEEGRLVWLETAIRGERSMGAKDKLQEARNAASRRLVNTLLWEEVGKVQINLGPQARGDVKTPSSPSASTDRLTGPDYFKGIDLSPYPNGKERKGVRARIVRRIERYGEAAALAMPIEAQKTGRKRKMEESDQVSRKKSQTEAAHGHNGGEEADEEEELDGRPESAVREPFGLKRFDQIGVPGESVCSLLSDDARQGLTLFKSNALQRLVNNAQGRRQGGMSHIEGLSDRTLALLCSLLRSHLSELISTTFKMASNVVNVRGNSIKRIQPEQVRAAILQCQPSSHETGPWVDTHRARLGQFRSDPPCHYTTHSSSVSELETQLHGLNSFAPALGHHQPSCSITSDAVISASDAFTIPTSSTFARPVDADGEVSEDSVQDSQDSSVYSDSDQDKEREERMDFDGETDETDRRRQDYDEEQGMEEERAWQRLQDRDEREDNRYERALWARLGLEPPKVGQLPQLDNDGLDDSVGESSKANAASPTTEDGSRTSSRRDSSSRSSSSG